MLGYYLDLALRSFKRNKVLTLLMVVTLALGIGASMTTLTVLRLLSGDPLPQKSGQLFYVQLDPYPKDRPFSRSGKLPWLTTYTDAMNLLHAHRAEHQAAMAMTRVKLIPTTTQQRPFFSNGVMATADFFSMFEAPFQYGSGWSAADDDNRAKVVVIADYLNDQLFGGANSVGRSLRINDQDFRIIGVLRHWAPQPRFYSLYLGGPNYGKGEAVFLPLQSARAAGMDPINSMSYAAGDKQVIENSPTIWLGLWVQLPDAAAVSAYQSFLASYAEQQVALGRFQRSRIGLSGLMPWLDSQQVVPDNVRMQTGLAFSFLLICMVNTVGLLLAKCLRRTNEIGVRRALGASRAAIFAQFMAEAGLIGLVGGGLGLMFALFGLWCIRQQPAEYASLAHLNGQMFLCTFAVALMASLVAGILPAWRACVVTPAPQLKSA
ncbi:ABC transporter permease [Dyella nitratireducens]|uniref:ABC transporter ATP-binding protein n=1 Tax=Dyella nitratireducens TaxID=1849580 RepID=A0ABQ1FNE9_9GAMM|nr:ABC transporter permease [Dyella nitratireducens]GGA22649.1 ABC transporter ATP-binding protein [Dyella nitratireducens]GLQ44082.1 ABC transporter ATP-binding protein [Dyella nitratireducens]